MEDFPSLYKKWHKEATLWLDQQDLEDKMVKDQQKVNGVDLEHVVLSNPYFKILPFGFKEKNFKKKLRKANLKIRIGCGYTLLPLEPGYSRKIKKSIQLFNVDAEIENLVIEGNNSSLSKTKTFQRISKALTSFNHGDSIRFQYWSQIDLAKLLMFTKNIEEINFFDGDFISYVKSLEDLKNFSTPTSTPILEFISIWVEDPSFDKLDQLLNVLKLHVEALLSSKFIQSLESINVEIYFGSFGDENNENFKSDFYDSLEVFKNIPNIKTKVDIIGENVIFSILFPEGQKQNMP